MSGYTPSEIEKKYFRVLVKESKLVKRTHDILRLYHYTNDSAKQKILSDQSVKLKLTRAKKFLDKNEGTHVLEPFYCAAGALYEEGKISKTFYRRMMKIGIHTLSELIKEDVFIVCFAKNGYSRYMKERYAPRDGWVLEFQNFLFDVCTAKSPDSVSFDLTTVIYSFKKIKSFFYECLGMMYTAFAKDEGDEEKKLDTCSWLISETIVSLCYAYKSPYYKQEEEVRLIAYVRPDFTDWRDEDSGTRLYFEKQNGRRELFIEISRKYLLDASQTISPMSDGGLNHRIMAADACRRAIKRAASHIKDEPKE